MRITSKGQVTIPADIREKAGLTPNADLDVTFDGTHIRLARVETFDREGRGARLVAHLEGSGDIQMSTDEIMALTRGE